MAAVRKRGVQCSRAARLAASRWASTLRLPATQHSIPRHEPSAPDAPPESAVQPDLRLALAAAAAVPGADRGPGRVRVPVRQGTVAPDPRSAEPGRAADHADRAWPDRRCDDLQPAGDGDR